MASAVLVRDELTAPIAHDDRLLAAARAAEPQTATPTPAGERL